MERLRTRREFLAAAKGSKVSRRAFVLQALDRGDDKPARIGFTVTRRTAKKAVDRNRIRRRLRETCRAIAPQHFNSGTDYVIIGRRPALTVRFAELKAELAAALQSMDLRKRTGKSAVRDMQRRADG